ncbi:MAG: branched-chain amino acid ABC transporter permease [Chloroflexi bacterium]|uniref:Branched-chain amino acid ABC transporter permease n=1 Tax=Candidatus Chlorohelix allophototropha TaxID=3003348 RepID=A0A8T7M8H6_9CHLR|nr:branched-chain amino acid ABC transporter permease [Chloroflexota bacterium]WJW68374.1 branched-chain amino acid ABC transporter permease [Chloroflexota bacterium L227-S17]
MPDFISNNIATINFSLINIALGLSIFITLFTGMLSLANAGFMAIGAYTAAVIATRTDFPLFGGFLLAIIVAVVVAIIFGLLIVRLREIFLAIATLGFGEIVRIFFLNGDKVVKAFTGDENTNVFNGAEGITIKYKSPQDILGLPETTWPLLLYVAVLIYFMITLQKSRFGRVLSAIRLDESAASTLGINVVRYRLLAFVIGAGIAAGAGALSTPIVRVIEPRNYVFGRAVDILASAVLGGMTTWIGPVLGAILLTALPEILRFLKDQREIVNGLIIMIAIIYLPRGISDPRFWSSLWRKRKSGQGNAAEVATEKEKEVKTG